RWEVVGDTRQDNVLDRGALANGGEGGVELIEHDNRSCARILELMLQFRRGIERIGRHNHRTCLERAVECDGELWSIWQTDRDAVATLDAQPHQRTGEALDE